MFNKVNSNLLIQILKNNFQSIRCYRFGNRVVPSGYYFANDFHKEKEIKKIDDENELRKLRNQLFDQENKRQKDLIARIEKIEVQVNEIPLSISENNSLTLLMNKDISTPFDCAQHIHQLFVKRSVLAQVDGTFYWDMHRPLERDCQIRFRHFKESENIAVNKAFWRSCSFLLGMVIEKAFKNQIKVYLHSWPKPNPESGSFVYDVMLNLTNWKPKQSELRVFTAMLTQLTRDNFKFERLEVSSEFAKKMFEYNKFKFEQIDDIASKSHNQGKVTLYRVGDHIDISFGPMISNTNQIGIIHTTAIHPIETNNGIMFRFQGIALPQQLNLTPFTYNILREKAKQLNVSGLNSLVNRKETRNNVKTIESVNEDDNHDLKIEKVVNKN